MNAWILLHGFGTLVLVTSFASGPPPSIQQSPLADLPLDAMALRWPSAGPSGELVNGALALVKKRQQMSQHSHFHKQARLRFGI